MLIVAARESEELAERDLFLRDSGFSFTDIKERLRTSLLGREILVYSNLDSTNARAMKLAEAGAAEGTVVIAEEQYQGRGRSGRAWVSPKGGLWLSIIFRPVLGPAEVFRLSMIASLAAAETIFLFTGLKAEIKWPNDVLINGRKVGGILLEMLAGSDSTLFVILGMGINVNFCPKQLPTISQIATSLLQETGRQFPRTDLLSCLLQKMENGYLALTAGGFPALFDQWKALLRDMGKWVEINTAYGKQRGVVESVDENGTLTLKLPDGQRVKIAIDLS